MGQVRLKLCSRLSDNYIQDWMCTFCSYHPELKTTQGFANKLSIFTQVWHRCGPNKLNFGTLGEYHKFTNTVKSMYGHGHGHQSHFCLISQHSEKCVFCHQIIKVVCDEQTDTLLTKIDKYIVVHYHPCA